jgi:hypothetical protein
MQRQHTAGSVVCTQLHSAGHRWQSCSVSCIYLTFLHFTVESVIFVKCLLSCPVLLCSWSVCSTSGQRSSTGEAGKRSFGQRRNANQDRLCASLFRSFFRPNAHHRVQNGPAALRRLYAISQYCHGGSWKRGAVRRRMPQSRFATIVHIINIARLLPSPKRWSL